MPVRIWFQPGTSRKPIFPERSPWAKAAAGLLAVVGNHSEVQILPLSAIFLLNYFLPASWCGLVWAKPDLFLSVSTQGELLSI